MAYLDCFWALGVVALAMMPLVLLMKRSVAKADARVAAE
jgi:hypothetical protein